VTISKRLTVTENLDHIARAFSRLEAAALRLCYREGLDRRALARALDQPSAEAAQKLIQRLVARPRYPFESELPRSASGARGQTEYIRWVIALVCADPVRLDPAYPEPQRRPGEALLALRVAGICDTDLQLCRGYMGYRGVLGHEAVAEVLDADDRAWIGQRVVADINAGCGTCSDCVGGLGHHCPARSVLGISGRDGALSERFTMPERTLVQVPESVPDSWAVFAEPLAAALHVLHDLPATDGPTVVLGDGKLGLLIAYALRSVGRRTLVVGHHEAKLALCRAVGAETVLERDLPAEHGTMPAVVEATGSAGGIALALSLVRPRGHVLLKTTVAGKTELDLSPIVIHELRVVGSRCGDLREAVAALAGGLDPTPLVAARYSLDQAAFALSHASRPGTLKVLVDGLPSLR
jgi:threonine dehydrogenase-like Zn-dependent dehydrogenase